jgi:hypothetical protein
VIFGDDREDGPSGWSDVYKQMDRINELESLLIEAVTALMFYADKTDDGTVAREMLSKVQEVEV